MKEFEDMNSRDRLLLVKDMLMGLTPEERDVFQNNVILNPDEVKFCSGCPRLVTPSSDDGDGDSGKCSRCGNVVCKFCGGVRFIGSRSVIVQTEKNSVSFTPQEDGVVLCARCFASHQNTVATQ